jgi:hypothetical protein
VTELSKSGVNNQELIKITGHSSSSSIKSYLQLDKDHHGKIITAMRGQQSISTETLSRSGVKDDQNQDIQGGPDITCQKNSGSLEGSNKSKKTPFVRSKIMGIN